MSNLNQKQQFRKLHLGSSRVGLLRRIVSETIYPQCIGKLLWRLGNTITETMPDTFQEQRDAELLTLESIKTPNTIFREVSLLILQENDLVRTLQLLT